MLRGAKYLILIERETLHGVYPEGRRIQSDINFWDSLTLELE